MQAADFAPSLPESIAEARLKTAAPTFLGRSPAARRVQAMIHRAVPINAPVLLVGAKGTGKERIARILHHFGGGDVATIEVVDAEEQGRLVGLGAFTYLANLEDLALEEQARLPALVGTGRIVIGTTLEPASDAGRAKLHPQIVRWASVRIDVPSLAERIEDLELLAMDIIAKLPSRRPIGGTADAALDCLRGYRFAVGNLDELAEVLEQAIGGGATETIELRDLPAKLRLRDVHHARTESPERQLCLEEAEKQAIRRALDYARGNKRKAARLLHIGKTTLYRKLQQYDLE